MLFANVDDQLVLCVDGRPVKFDAETTYSREEIGDDLPTEADLTPARIIADGSGLRVELTAWTIALGREWHWLSR